MTPKVEPTVEKWEREFYELYYEDKADYHIIVQFIEKLLSLSVQEAKAERDMEWIKALKTTAYTTPTDNSTSGFIERVVKAIDLDLLASLKQEEGG